MKAFLRSPAYFAVFSPNTGKHGQEKSPYLDTFQAMNIFVFNHLEIALDK